MKAPEASIVEAPPAEALPGPPPADIEADDVVTVPIGEREVILVGTAHVSRDSVERVREVIAATVPDAVAVELDERRFAALADAASWANLDLRGVIRHRQLATLLVNVLLAAYQRRLGLRLGVVPGSELLAAVRAAEALGVPFHLCDRDVRVTLKRAWARLGWWRKCMLLSNLLAVALDKPVIGEEDLRRLRRQDVLSELLAELGREMPEVKRALIDERDAYLAERIRRVPGNRVVAVVGAGHVEGLRAALAAGTPVDLEPLDEVPPPSSFWTWAAWSIPALFVASLAWIGWTKGADVAGTSALRFMVLSGAPCALGGALALAHPLTILVAFLAAPFANLSPLVGSGYVAAFVQAWLRPPRVSEFDHLPADVASARGWFQNRLLRIFVVFLFTGIGSFVGLWLGGAEIVSQLR